MYLGTKRNTPVIPSWFQPCQCCCCLCYSGEYLWLGTVISYNSAQLVTVSSSCPFTLISVLMLLVMFVITGFNLVNAAVCAILESTPGLGPSSVITEPRYLKLVTVSNLCLFILISVLRPLVLFVNSLVFSALISMVKAVEALSRRSTNFTSSSSSPTKPPMSSAKRRLVIALPPLLTVPL